MVVKSYRASIAHEGQDKISLHTPNGKMGYRILKFQVIFQNPQGSSSEAVVQVWKKKQSAISPLIDFDNNELLAAAFASCSTAGDSNPEDIIVVFDGEIFNQDIYVTNDCSSESTMNYYLELEQLDLSDSEAQAAILKSIRTG